MNSPQKQISCLGIKKVPTLKIKKLPEFQWLDSFDVVCLNLDPVLLQVQATRTESVTPFIISFWGGSIELTPASDNWVDTNRLEAKIIETEGNYNEVFNDNVEAGVIDPHTKEVGEWTNTRQFNLMF